MSGPRFMLAAFLLPFAIISVSQGGLCKRTDSTRTKLGSSKPATTQTNHSTREQQAAVDEGLWGGPGIRMQVNRQGAEIEYDCARGTISEPIRLDVNGRFQVKGTHQRDRPGPIRLGQNPNAQPASYTGNVKEQTMTLEVTLTAKSENIGNFTLTRGRDGRLRKCL